MINDHLPILQVYTNSLLATLNARKMLRGSSEVEMVFP